MAKEKYSHSVTFYDRQGEENHGPLLLKEVPAPYGVSRLLKNFEIGATNRFFTTSIDSVITFTFSVIEVKKQFYYYYFNTILYSLLIIVNS